MAQTAETEAVEPSESAVARPAGLEEIVVTANKREQSLQKVPIAVSAFTENSVRTARIENFRDVVVRIPNFYADTVSRTQASLSMRGAGSLEDSPGSDQAVALFLDEVYIGENSGLDFDFFDVERIEVLRGPQGTLFGRNVMGGAVSIITRKPTAEPEATVEATFGRFNQFDVRGMVSGPLVGDTLMGQFSFSSKNSNGFGRNIATGNRLEQDDTQSARGKLRFKPNDDLDVNLSVGYMRDKSQGALRRLAGDFPADLNNPEDIDSAPLNLDGGYDRETASATLRVDYKTALGMLTSISGYRKGLHKSSLDLDGTALKLASFESQKSRIRQFSQELRLGGTVGSLDYVIGAYYLSLKNQRDEGLVLEGYPGSIYDEFFPGGTNGTEFRGQFVHTKSYSGFGQFTWHIGSNLRLTGGARYTWEEKAGQSYCLQDGALCSAYRFNLGDNWNAFTPKATIDFDVTDEILAYASVSRGFKGGGFAGDYATEEVARIAGAFDPEYAWSYEAGVKARWLDNRLQTNVTIYRVNYTDLQVRELSGPAVVVGNAGKSRVNGVELELVTRPVSGLEIFGNYSYTDGKFKDLILEGNDYSGNRLILTPKHAFTVGGNYTADLGDESALTVRGDVLYKSKSFLSVSNTPYSTAKYNGVVNGSVSYTLPGGKWEFSVFGKNITNVRTMVTASDFSVFFLSGDQIAAGQTAITTSYNRPATYGFSARWKY